MCDPDSTGASFSSKTRQLAENDNGKRIWCLESCLLQLDVPQQLDPPAERGKPTRQAYRHTRIPERHHYDARVRRLTEQHNMEECFGRADRSNCAPYGHLLRTLQSL